MKKLFSIALALFIMVQSFSLNLVDLAQLDDFLKHAKFHQEKYGDSLLVFISKHYGDLKQQHHLENREEQKEHEKLPFNQQNTCYTANAFVLHSYDVLLPKSLPITDTTSYFFYKNTYSQISESDIFQPPKQA
ncbi:hypothetical protein SAMN04487911_1214 [Arenibacter nanhaiticus]|uniref:Uncharacterized protein n=1 Tax=Arenibacter nanhaiticus TaxID=558155 RepID=A0A1M6J8V5_9FLAO|nr:hypothetical protein [Arenibacter nanhaiticus]SHJ43135.1 hypothetical protein SAMN04487911_1214 [Arenibacter nanhaiticus]